MDENLVWLTQKWQPPPHFYINPPFQGYPPFLAKFWYPPSPPPAGDSIFWRSYPLPLIRGGAVPTMLFSWVQKTCQAIGLDPYFQFSQTNALFIQNSEEIWWTPKISKTFPQVSFHGRSPNGSQVKNFKFFQISTMVITHWDEKILKIWWPYLFSLQSYSDINEYQ